MKKLFLALCCLLYLSSFTLSAQGVTITDDGSEPDPDPSAVLDVVSTQRGMLIPRMTTTQRAAIANPAVGLLVFDLTTETFWFKETAGWVELGSGGDTTTLTDADADTKIQVEESTDEDIIRFDVAGEERLTLTNDRLVMNFPDENMILNSNSASPTIIGIRNTLLGKNASEFSVGGSNNVGIGYAALRNNNENEIVAIGSFTLMNNGVGTTAPIQGDANTAIGSGALRDNTIGWYNTAVGFYAMPINIDGTNNTALGALALNKNSSGSQNVALGNAALPNNTAGERNVGVGNAALHYTTTQSNLTAVGFRALWNNGLNATLQGEGINNTGVGTEVMFSNKTGSQNIAVGNNALSRNQIGNNNTAIGYQAGFQAAGTGNVFIGNQAGYFETAGERLYIENSNSSLPLIYGEFDNDLLRVNGQLEVTNNVTLNGGDLTLNGGSVQGVLDINGRIHIGDHFSNPSPGAIRYNSTVKDFEGYDGTQWNSFTQNNSSSMPTNQYYSICPCDFQATEMTDFTGSLGDHSFEVNSSSTGYTQYNGFWEIISAVHLPHGASITKFEMFLESASDLQEARLARRPIGGGTEEVIATLNDSFDGPANNIYSASIANHSVDNLNYYYYITASSEVESIANGGRITYTE